ncbi:hypothetical protein CDL15_Pgr020156 [Punica granatum]|uniref:Uncharacterized protein n=1 Tax=Punica granatum TaxID=22663 RepID=A0A218VSH4_PUNGR|nr:hypothetical protein CDL15_Pgr020156 [Punica granatum]
MSRHDHNIQQPTANTPAQQEETNREPRGKGEEGVAEKWVKMDYHIKRVLQQSRST